MDRGDLGPHIEQARIARAAQARKDQLDAEAQAEQERSDRLRAQGTQAAIAEQRQHMRDYIGRMGRAGIGPQIQLPLGTSYERSVKNKGFLNDTYNTKKDHRITGHVPAWLVRVNEYSTTRGASDYPQPDTYAFQRLFLTHHAILVATCVPYFRTEDPKKGAGNVYDHQTYLDHYSRGTTDFLESPSVYPYIDGSVADIAPDLANSYLAHTEGDKKFLGHYQQFSEELKWSPFQ